MGFCTTCGKALEEGARFCTACGMAVPAAPPPAPAVTPAPTVAAAPAMAPEPQPGTYPVAETASPGSSSSFFLIAGGILVLLIVCGVAATLYLRHQSKPREATQTTATQQQDEVDSYIQSLNLGNYPNATPVAIATLSGEKIISGFLTKDSPGQVMQFYKIRFPVSEVSVNGPNAMMTATLANGQVVRIYAEPQGTSTQVRIVVP